jgi:hypothetical protein
VLKALRPLAALGLAIAAVGMPVRADGQVPGSGGSEFYSADAVASGVFVEVVVNNLTVVNQLVGLSTGTSTAHLSTDGISAKAAMPDPGDLVVSAPGLLAAAAGLANLPSYPLQVEASYPDAPHVELAVVPNLDLRGGNLVADAAVDRASASTQVDRAAALGVVAGFGVAAVGTEARAIRRSATDITATATSDVTDITLLDGLVHIASVSSHLTARIGPSGPIKPEVDTVVSGVSVLGTPVGVDQDGLVLAGAPVALAPVLDTLTQALADQGLQVRLAPSVVSADGTGASSGALVVELATTLGDFPARVRLTFGAVRSALTSGSAIPAAPTPSGSAAEPALPSAPIGSGSVLLPGDLGRPTGAGRPSAPAPLARVRATSSLLDFRAVYRWAGLGAAAVLVAPYLVPVVGRRRRWRRRLDTTELQELWRW